MASSFRGIAGYVPESTAVLAGTHHAASRGEEMPGSRACLSDEPENPGANTSLRLSRADNQTTSPSSIVRHPTMASRSFVLAALRALHLDPPPRLPRAHTQDDPARIRNSHDTSS
jgi:hypothetical protein